MTGSSPRIEQVETLLRSVADDVLLPRFLDFDNSAAISDQRFARIVAAASRTAEARISSELTALWPGSRVIGEDVARRSPNVRRQLEQGNVWLVDPLDGTRNFVAGLAPFTLMVAQLQNGEPVRSWILAPLRAEIAVAERGAGAFIAGRRLRTSEGSVSLSHLRGRIMTHSLPEKIARQILRRSVHIAEVLSGVGSNGTEYIRLARRTSHFSIYGRALPWNHAPGVLFLSEAGGHVARSNGEPYRVWDEQTGLIAAANYQIWNDVRRALFTNAAALEAKAGRRSWVEHARIRMF